MSSNYKEAWQRAMDELREEYKKNGAEQEFAFWFNMKYSSDEANEITVSAPSEFLWTQMTKRGNVQKVANKIRALTGQPDVSIKPTITNESIAEADGEEAAQTSAPPKKAPPKHPQLREEFTFENFVPGDNSSFAYNAALAVAKQPGDKYNPLLFYGGVGLGKTHLMQAVGNFIYKANEGKIKLACISAESFTNEFISSIKLKTTDKFSAKYRHLDVLLLDDIYFLQNKPAVQQELFYTFNDLRDRNCQMVFTCDRPVSELKGLTDRIENRLKSGICIDLQPPSYEVRRAILLKKLESSETKISDDVIDYIAQNVESNVRDLEHALKMTTGYAELMQKPLTLDTAKSILARDAVSGPQPGAISIETIQKIVADEFQISVSDLTGKKRDKKYVAPRQIAFYIAREMTEYSLTELGREFGDRNHSTVMHSCDVVEDLLKTDATFSARLQALMEAVKTAKR